MKLAFALCVLLLVVDEGDSSGKRTHCQIDYILTGKNAFSCSSFFGGVFACRGFSVSFLQNGETTINFSHFTKLKCQVRWTGIQVITCQGATETYS